MTAAGITNDVWGTAFTMMDNLRQNALFSSGGYSVVMAQYGNINYLDESAEWVKASTIFIQN